MKLAPMFLSYQVEVLGNMSLLFLVSSLLLLPIAESKCAQTPMDFDTIFIVNCERNLDVHSSICLSAYGDFLKAFVGLDKTQIKRE